MKRSATTPRTPGFRRSSAEDASGLDEDRPTPEPARDTDQPDELDALPGHEGSR